ncbi:MAG: Na+/H+ antiporter subunit E, partial [Candidatus Aenigmarchaeota archaeon]|nr:Na+/H+ antiporter subunit E [Candidatus Aenigmarchaeota archaeon]
GLAFWLLISGYDTQILTTDLIVSLVSAGIVLKLSSGKSHKIKLNKFLTLIPMYLIEIVKSIAYMIYFIFSGRIQPDIKEIKLNTDSKRIHDCVAFSITNLPGSVAISSKNKSFTSHSIVFDKNYVDGVKKFESFYLKMMGVKSDK